MDTMDKEVQKLMVGKNVVVRSNVAGVHMGTVAYLTETLVILKNSRRMWDWDTNDESGSLSDIVANGLRPDKKHYIGVALETVFIGNPPGLEVAELSQKSYDSIMSYK